MDGTAAERTETAPDAERTETAPERTAPTEIFLVRHGERVDETAEAPLFYLNCGDRGWDPPLTQEGRRQADSAGRELLRAHQRRPARGPGRARVAGEAHAASVDSGP